MTNSRIKDNSVKGLMLFGLFTVMSIKSCTVNAQVFRGANESLTHKEKKVHHEILRKLKVKMYEKYFGGELSLATPRYKLQSNIAALDGLPVSYLGTNLGVVAGNSIGKLKMNVGLYYSDSSVPYTLQMYQERITGSIYPMRMLKAKCRAFEPYVSVGITRQQTQFYGNYLGSDKSTNYSTTEQPFLGAVGFSQINLDAGVEYRINTPHNFIHVFGELGYGVLVSSNTSDHEFSKTRLSNSSSISLGVSFGLLK